jgi:hypothetical protein
VERNVGEREIDMRMKSIIVTCMLVGLVGAVCSRDAVAGTKAHASIGSVSRNPGKDTAGKRIYLMTIRTTQYGVDFFGTLKTAFEVTDGAGQLYYGTNTFTQQCAYKSQSDCEWVLELKVDSIDKPTLTAYSIEFYAPDVDEPLNWKTRSCKDAAELTARNKDSKQLTVRGRSESLVSKEMK